VNWKDLPGCSGAGTYRHRDCLEKDSGANVAKSRKQKTDIGKYSFVNKTIQLWNYCLQML
jgi:hypothetical protein